MTSNEQFFQSKRAAAVLKHGVLSRYPLVFASMTGSRSTDGRVVFLDGYAGPGKYEDGEPGSPLLAVRMAATAGQWSRKVECVFIERDPVLCANLQECLTEEAPAALSYRVLVGDVGDHVAAVVTRAGDAPLLAFLDPFGTAMDYSVLKDQLLARPTRLKTEVLLNFNLESVTRIGGRLQDPSARGADKSLQRVDRFLGGEWWRQVFLQARGDGGPGSASRAARAVAERFCAIVAQDTQFGSFQVEVRRRPDSNPLFLLVLFFRSDVAPWKFNEAVSMANHEWRQACLAEEVAEYRAELEAKEAAGQGMLFSIEEVAQDHAASREDETRRIARRDEEEWVTVIEKNLRSLLAADPVVPLRSRIGDVFTTTLGSARDKHLNAAWKRLVDDRTAAPKEPGVKYLYNATLRRA